MLPTVGIYCCGYVCYCGYLSISAGGARRDYSSEAVPNTQELDVTYEEVDTLQSQTIRLEENVAYGPVKQSKEIELKENVAYGPVKRT